MWFVIGIVLGVLLLAFINWMRKNNVSITWYEWIIGLVGMALLLFTVQNFFGEMATKESVAAWMFLLVVGLPAVILLAVAWQLVTRRIKAG